MPNNSEIKDVAVRAAREAGKLITEIRNNETLNVSTKSAANDLVTQADLASEKLLLETLRTSLKASAVFLSEETNKSTDISKVDPASILWVIDPIDGTTNYAFGHAQSAISIAAAHSGHVQVAVVYNPFRDEMFTAIRGEGAYLNGKKINIIEPAELKRALIATGFLPQNAEDHRSMVENVSMILSNNIDFRRLGAASLDICMIACGRLHAYYENVWPWDIAAAALIAREAGAIVGHYGKAISFNSTLEEELNCDRVLVGTPMLYNFLKNKLK